MALIFSPDEFVKRLRSGQFSANPVAATGLVKLPDGKTTALLFAQGTVCEDWTEIPIKLIESIQFLRVARCGDHSHPFVTLYLAEAESEEGKTFRALAAANSGMPQSGRMQAHSVATVGAHSPPVAVHPQFLSALHTAGLFAHALTSDDCGPGYFRNAAGKCEPIFR